MAKKLFVHIPKNGGLTIRKSLKQYAITAHKDTLVSADYTNRLTAVMNKNGEHPGYEHARWRDISKSLTDNYQAFAVVRNPWTRVVSRYMMLVRGFIKGTIPEGYAPREFEEYLEDRHKWKDAEFYWHRPIRGWYEQVDHVTDEEGNIRCDILRFEHYENDLRAYLNLPPNLVIQAHNHANREIDRWKEYNIDYLTMYNDTTKEIVADWYKNDIETFGFTFESAATKNIWRNDGS